MSAQKKKSSRLTVLLLACCLGASAATYANEKEEPAASSEQPKKKRALDRTGEPREGKASYYGKYFFGRTMADGTPMDPDANIAASRTLPLGTVVEVTNVENGKSEVVEIRDRGPYIDGRIIDLSPKVAQDLDMMEEGVVEVVVTPIEIPMPDGTVTSGAAARENTKAGR